MAGEIEIRADQFQAFVAGRSIDLTRREFELIQLLADAHGQVLQREEIYQRVWGYAMAHGDRSVDVFVRKLRRKLEQASPRWNYIHTHFGVGYRFDPEPAGEGSGAEAERPRSGRGGRRGPGPRRDGVTPLVRNVLIVLALAAALAFLPGGGDAARLVGATLSFAFLAGLAWFAVRLYLEHRVAIDGLGERNRAIAYVAVGALALGFTGTSKLWATGPGTAVWLVMVGGASFALYRVWQSSRRY